MSTIKITIPANLSKCKSQIDVVTQRDTKTGIHTIKISSEALNDMIKMMSDCGLSVEVEHDERLITSVTYNI